MICPRRESLLGTDPRAWLQGADVSRAALQGADLSWAQLQGADLAEASLQGAKLRHAKLSGTDLFRASLEGASLVEADLKGANIEHAILVGADLGGANLQGADLSKASLEGANLGGPTAASINTGTVHLQGTNLDGALLQGADLGWARIWMTKSPGLDRFALASTNMLNVGALDDDERNILRDALKELELLEALMNVENTPGRTRVATALMRIKTRVSPLLDKKNDKIPSSDVDLRSWCKLAHGPQAEIARISAYIGKLACNDYTEKAFTAKRLIERAVRLAPNTFLKHFRGCVAFDRVSVDLRSRLEQEARKDKEREERVERVRALARRACVANDSTMRLHIVQGLQAELRSVCRSVRNMPRVCTRPSRYQAMAISCRGQGATVAHRSTDNWQAYT